MKSYMCANCHQVSIYIPLPLVLLPDVHLEQLVCIECLLLVTPPTEFGIHDVCLVLFLYCELDEDYIMFELYAFMLGSK